MLHIECPYCYREFIVGDVSATAGLVYIYF